jgi:hypothetical protein
VMTRPFWNSSTLYDDGRTYDPRAWGSFWYPQVSCVRAGPIPTSGLARIGSPRLLLHPFVISYTSSSTKNLSVISKLSRRGGEGGPLDILVISQPLLRDFPVAMVEHVLSVDREFVEHRLVRLGEVVAA